MYSLQGSPVVEAVDHFRSRERERRDLGGRDGLRRLSKIICGSPSTASLYLFLDGLKLAIWAEHQEHFI